MHDIGFEEALDLVRKHISPLSPETILSWDLVGRVCANDVSCGDRLSIP